MECYCIMEKHPAIALKLSFRFRKIGAAKYHSHHDMMRFFDRALKRAKLPVRQTEGFNPRPRMVFPHALSLGIQSNCEEIEVEFTRYSNPNIYYDALRKACEPMIELTHVTVLQPTRRGRIVKRSIYKIDGPTDISVENAINTIANAKSIYIKRGSVSEEREVEIRQYIEYIEIRNGFIWLALSHDEKGCGRADEIVKQIAAHTKKDFTSWTITREQIDWVI